MFSKVPGRELRHVLRKLVHAPLFTGISVVTLGLGIGANAAIFSVVHGVLLKPLPFQEPDRLVGVWHTAPGLGFTENVNQSPATYFTYREESETFDDIGMWDNSFVSVTGLDEPAWLEALRVTDGTFPILGIAPVLGRTFTAEDDAPGSPETVMISFGYWQQQFGGERDALGQTLVVDGRPREIIGVMPDDFRFLRYDPAVILPFRFDRADVFMGNFSFQALARLNPGVTLEQANADVARMIPIAVENFPGGLTLDMIRDAQFGPSVRPLSRDVVGDVDKVLWVLAGTVGLVLLIACANVANLLLVRADGRQQEIAVRAAMGAGRRRLALAFLFESVTLGLLGGVAGLLFASGAVQLLAYLRPDSLPRIDDIGIGGTVLGFTLAVSVVAGVLFGLIPLVKYGRPNLASALKEGGRGTSEGRERHFARSVLVVAQVALALVLLVGSGLMIRSFQSLRNVHPGFVEPEDILTFRIFIPETEVDGPEQTARAHEQLLRRIEALPGVRSIGLSTSITMDGWDSNDGVDVEEFPVEEGQLPPIRRFKWISENYFETMGNPILAGRGITWTDIYEKRPVVVVTENFAREYWEDASSAVGKRIRNFFPDRVVWREIVGVVGDIHDDGVDQDATMTVFWPMVVKDLWDQELMTLRTMSYAIRSDRTGSPGFLDEIRNAVWSVNSNLPLSNVSTGTEILSRSMARTSFTLVMLGIASGVALVLGVIGIYGVISYSVSQRTREIGVRMALGAGHKEVSTLVLREGLFLTSIGLVVGIGIALFLTRWMTSLLFGVGAIDPLTYGAVALALAAVATTAAYLPARRASNIPPTDALRWE